MRLRFDEGDEEDVKGEANWRAIGGKRFGGGGRAQGCRRWKCGLVSGETRKGDGWSGRVASRVCGGFGPYRITRARWTKMDNVKYI